MGLKRFRIVLSLACMLIFLRLQAQENQIINFFPEIDVLKSNGPSEGYFFFGSKGLTAQNACHYIAIIDNYGTPVFFRKMNSLTPSMRLLKDGRIAYIHGRPRKLYFLDSMLHVCDTLNVQGFRPDGHDWAVSDEGHFLLMGKHKWTYDMSQLVEGGNPEAEIVDLIIQEFDEEYNLLYTWNSADHFEITDGNEKSDYLDFTEEQIDYVHANAVTTDSDTSFLISSRHMDEITKVDRRTGEIIWRLGGKRNQFEFLNDSIGFSHQHSIRKLKNGNMLLFDNGNLHSEKISSAVEYQLNEENRTIKQIKRYYHDSLGYSNHGGAVQGLENGNVIACWGPYWPSFTEFHPDGSIALDWDFTKHSFSPRIEKYKWQTQVFETSTDSLAFETWENDTLVQDFWVKNNYSDSISITTIHKHSEYFGIAENLPQTIAPGDSIKLNCWFYPLSAETGFLTDLLTLAYDTENQRIARQLRVSGWTNDQLSPAASLLTGSLKVPLNSSIQIQFTEPVRKTGGEPFNYNSIDDYIVFKTNNSAGEPVPFNAVISSDNKNISIDPVNNFQGNSNYYISLKQGISDFSGNELIPFEENFTTVSTNNDFYDLDKTISVYPNPAKDFLQISTDAQFDKVQVKLYNQTGRLLIIKLLKNGNNERISLSTLKAGVYYLQIETEKNTKTEKIIKY